MSRKPGEHELIVACREAGRQLAATFQPVVPFLLQAGASVAAYTGGLAAAQAAGMALRVSCATPIAGPIGGLLGVGLASAAAGQASIKCRQYLQDKQNPLLQPWKGSRAEDLLVDAVLGIAMFKVMGGRFRSVMPSDLAKVGAIARESLPATHAEYATDASRVELARYFRRDGCHHCGTRRGKVIGDHMPPNKYVKQYIASAKRTLLSNPYLRQMAGALNIQTGPPRQRYYPQCTSCMQKQASAIRNDKTVLVFHQVLHHGGRSQAWHYSGALLGMRHYTSSGSSSRGGNGRRR
ncbi:pfkB family carbohydrate kinase [Chlorella sorokiniana]|uniref:PfkB family carbohydrate kinase n=1 Tax=Chlorella sorokiniana TaxID=3076 RepID=A0A2P6U035_CHLSO|nr:pfkB family carbohydrate kinase [Chlorella sorokiniana]|eukprot:PRW59668.1 pfkB family carbohydrate kinase [Chlorella sorokiniana]